MKVTASTGIFTLIAGTRTPTLGVVATSCDLAYPCGVTVDSRGNVFFTNDSTNSTYKITASTGLLSLVAGNNKYRNNGYYGDGVVASTGLIKDPRYTKIDALGNLFFSDTDNHRVRKVRARTGIITTVAGQIVIDDTCVYTNGFENALSPSICSPKGIAVDIAGNSDTRFVRKVKFADADVTIADVNVKTFTARHVIDTYSFTAILLVTLLLTLYVH